MKYKKLYIVLIFLIVVLNVFAQPSKINWTEDGNAYTRIKSGNIERIDPKTELETILIKKEQLTPEGSSKPLNIKSYSFSSNNTKCLLFTNTAKVWRYNTRGDYWILDLTTNKLSQLGIGKPSQSLMYAKLSPNGKKCAYVSNHNIFVEELNSNKITPLTNDGTRKLINGTFDWAYEEEFGNRDGFRWNSDGTKIAFWQIDASKIRDYFMLNTTDSNYSKVIPVEYPKVGENPSPAKIGVINLENGFIKWMDIPGDAQQHYIPRMEWVSPTEIMIQQLDRKQQESKLMYCNANDGNTRTIWAESDDAWVDINSADVFWEPGGFNWLKNGQDFIWISEKDGWRHLYKISKDGKTETLLTKGKYDIESISCIDEINNYIYFMASLNNATQKYLYRVRLNQKPSDKNEPELLSNISQKGTHEYSISPNGKMAFHNFSNYNTPFIKESISLPDNKPFSIEKSIAKNIKIDKNIDVEYIKVTTEDNITLDAWIRKPKNFDSTKKYPVVFYVYGEPAAATISDEYGNHNNFLYKGDMSADGYFIIALDNRGTPVLKGAAWRKAIYKNIGILNIRDMAMGAKKILEKPYFDKDRVAVWGWSGGGSSTLNLMFQYPQIFKTGISIAAISNQLLYDNIYQERYMGLPQENMEAFIKGSPMTYAKNLEGNLLYIHGTGDDNVQYDNAEVLLNELIKYNKQFQFMAYPNRTHNINEGAGTSMHLSTLYTNFLRKNCEPGAKAQ